MEISDNTYQKIYKYLHNEMNSQELQDFEVTLVNDDYLRDTVNILKKMDGVYNTENWSLLDKNVAGFEETLAMFRSKDVEDFSQKIKSASKALDKVETKSNLRRIIIYASSIAAVGLILFFGFFSEKQFSNQELYNHYYNAEQLPSFVSKSNGTEDIIKAELLFKEQKYQEALLLFDSINTKAPNKNPSVLIYLAQANAELERYDVAINYLSNLEKSNAIDYHKAYWFKSLLYLKQGKKDKAISVLKNISNNKTYFNHDKAVELLEKLQ